MSYDVTIRRQELAALVDLKGRPEDVAAAVAWAALPLPDLPNSRTRAGDKELYWVGPDQWLLRGPLAAETDLLRQVQTTDAARRLSVVQVSDVYAFFGVFGRDAAEILAVASPLDIHPSAFPQNASTFTDAFGLKTLVIRRADGFELAVERSFAEMAADYLQRVAAVPLDPA
ncbi:sarcosine oxidase subunit gamma family protein [Geminicoccaceae bacterium 1502E]|nr:sarcosine oxidase subunit gamma family protein [Geminicoccaceae bacterium 1502E]